MEFRVLRFPISEDTYECVITNLPSTEFNLEEIKKLYAMRCGIMSPSFTTSTITESRYFDLPRLFLFLL